VLVGAYALGKAQRVIAELRRAGHTAPIWLHGAMEAMCRLYIEHGIDLGDLRLAARLPKRSWRGRSSCARPPL
jgi:putative mRNA 3-end processing factor